MRAFRGKAFLWQARDVKFLQVGHGFGRKNLTDSFVGPAGSLASADVGHLDRNKTLEIYVFGSISIAFTLKRFKLDDLDRK